MPFTLDDVAHLMGGNDITPISMSRETIQGETASVQSMNAAQIKAMFPGVDFSESNQITYFPIKMCHSLPVRNKRGRSFTPKTMQNSCASAVDSLINLEHCLRDNGLGDEDAIIGHIKAAVFTLPKELEVASDTIFVPEEAIPMYALGALMNRAAPVPDIIKNHLCGKQRWAVSMECGHKWSEAVFYHEKEFIPLKDASSQMLQCIGREHVKPYKDRELTVCLGGVDGRVDYWGLGMTTHPADAGADILALVAGRSMELASKKTFYMPLHYKNFPASEKSKEVASEYVDKAINDLANMTILGETQPAEDGHMHQVLSDLTILPAQGHVHYVPTFNISRGTTPRLTGRTGPESIYSTDNSGNRREQVHLHLFDIPLKGKASPVSGSSGGDTGGELSNLTGEDEMAFKDLLAKLEASLAKLSTGKTGDDNKEFVSELASLRSDLANLGKEEIVKEAVQSAIEAEIKAGKLVRKEVADEATAAAVKAAEDKAAADLALQTKRSTRLTEIIALGVDPNLEYGEGLNGADGKPLTIKSHIESIGVDDAGEADYKRTFVLLKGAAAASAKATEVTAAAVASAGKETANKPARSFLSVVGSPGGLSPEAAAKGAEENKGGSANDATAKKVGRHAVTSGR